MFNSPLDAFTTHDPGSGDQYANVGAGFGDHVTEVAAAGDFDDAALFPPFYIEDLSANGYSFIRPRQPGTRFGGGSGSFSVFRPSGTAGGTGRLGDDGIDCYDAAPTGEGYNALFLGNQCQTYLNQFTIGDYGNPSFADPVHDSWASSDFPASYSNHLLQIGFNGIRGKTIIIAVIERNVTAPGTSSVPGWQRIPVGPDALGYAITVYAKTWDEELGGTNTLDVPMAAASGKVEYAIVTEYQNAGLDPLNPIEAWTTTAADGAVGTAPGVTTVGPGSKAISIIVKDLTGGTGFTTTPAGWVSEVNRRFTFAPFAGAAVGVATKDLGAAGSASGTASWTGTGLSGTGVAVTLSLSRGPGLNTAATSGSVSFSGLPFEPELLLFCYCDPRGFGGFDGGSFMYGATDGTNQWVTAVKAAFGSGPTGTGGILGAATRYRRFRTDACLHFIGSPSQFTTATPNDITISCTSIDPTGFTLNIIDLVGIASIVVLAVKANDGRGAFKVGSSTQPSVGTQSFSGFGFRPDAVVFASGKTTDQAMHSDYGAMSLGMSDGVTDVAGWAEDYTWPFNAQPLYPPMNYVTQSAALVIPDSTTSTVLAAASLQSLDADGFTLDWTTSDSVARLFGWVALWVDSDPTTPPFSTTLPITNVIFAGPSHTFVTFNGLVTPNSSFGDPVTYHWQISNGPSFTPGPSTFNTPTLTDGSGGSEVAVNTTFDIGSYRTIAFCYRLVVVTSAGCPIYGDTFCTNGPLPVMTFGNKFRVEQ